MSTADLEDASRLTAADQLLGSDGRPGLMGTGSSVLNRAEQAAAAIEKIVKSAEPGARLGTKEELRKACGVAVGTFNEALRLLQTRGLVVVRPGPGGGLFAAEPSVLVRFGNAMLALDASAMAVGDATRLRDALDPLLMDDALAYASPADIMRVRGKLETMRVVSEAGDAVAYFRANWELHAEVAGISPNQLLSSFYRSLLEIVRTHTLDVHGTQDQPLQEYLRENFLLHERMVDAIEQRDEELAHQFLTDHNTTSNKA